MSNPIKPTITPIDPEMVRDAMNVAHKHLLNATEMGAKEMMIGGADFVIIGIGIWARELAELNAKATSQMMEAISIICDPKTKPQALARAERKRRLAVRKIFAAVDLAMSKPEGSV